MKALSTTFILILFFSFCLDAQDRTIHFKPDEKPQLLDLGNVNIGKPNSITIELICDMPLQDRITSEGRVYELVNSGYYCAWEVEQSKNIAIYRHPSKELITDTVGFTLSTEVMLEYTPLYATDTAIVRLHLGRFRDVLVLKVCGKTTKQASSIFVESEYQNLKFDASSGGATPLSIPVTNLSDNTINVKVTYSNHNFFAISSAAIEISPKGKANLSVVFNSDKAKLNNKQFKHGDYSARLTIYNLNNLEDTFSIDLVGEPKYYAANFPIYIVLLIVLPIVLFVFIFLLKRIKQNQKLRQHITDADSNFESGNYRQALLSYKNAITIKPADSEIKSRIKQTEEIISRNTVRVNTKAPIVKQQTIEKQPANPSDLDSSREYYISIGKADTAYGNENYVLARNYYHQALQFKENDTYALQKLNQIEFHDCITKANKEFERDNFLLAAEYYEKALIRKPGDLYTSNRIQESKYKEILKSADIEFALKNFAEAEKLYKQALTTNANDVHAGKQLLEIKYNRWIASGEQEFEKGNWEKSQYYFDQALKHNPNNLSARLKLNDILYNLNIERADYEYSLGNLHHARIYYQETFKYNQHGLYATQRIVEIDKQLNNPRMHIVRA